METKTIAVIGMMCAGCAGNVERKLRAMEGVETANVNLAARTALVTYNPELTNPQQMKAELAAIGYDMVVEENRNVEQIERRSYLLLRRKVAVSCVLALLTMAICMGWISVGGRNVANQLMMILAMANLAYCGRSFYASAWRQLTHGSANMDTLVAMSTGVSFVFSVFNTIYGDRVWGARNIEWHTYYDASVMIITFVLIGRLLEEKAKHGTAAAIRSLMGLAPKTARLVAGATIVDTPIGALQPGDILEVRAGDKIPVDGRLQTEPTAAATVNESMISGEPEAVEKHAGDRVLAGTVAVGGTLRFVAEEVGAKTMLANIIRMVQEAQGSKAPVQRVVDKAARVFVPVVLALSVLTFIIWWAVGGKAMIAHALLSAVSVLVIACPCAMGLATPTALMVGIGKAAQRNILIKDATALESLRSIDAMVIDKTGTLTIPTPDAAPVSPQATLVEKLERRETLKPHAREAIERLHAEGIAVYMMSGDREEAVKYWAEKAGIGHWQSQVMPQDKENLVRSLQSAGHKVAMVGDGINDSQALATADVSIAMGKGTDVAMDVAQVTLMGTDLRRIGDAIALSRRTVAMIRQNLFWAFVYNIVCIPLAAGAFSGIFHFQITPMWASALMAMSSVSVVANSLRLKWAKD